MMKYSLVLNMLMRKRGKVKYIFSMCSCVALFEQKDHNKPLVKVMSWSEWG
jgi:hypothetical protein